MSLPCKLVPGQYRGYEYGLLLWCTRVQTIYYFKTTKKLMNLLSNETSSPVSPLTWQVSCSSVCEPLVLVTQFSWNRFHNGCKWKCVWRYLFTENNETVSMRTWVYWIWSCVGYINSVMMIESRSKLLPPRKPVSRIMQNEWENGLKARNRAHKKTSVLLWVYKKYFQF